MKIFNWLSLIILIFIGIITGLIYFTSKNINNSLDPPLQESFYFPDLLKTTFSNEAFELQNPVVYFGNDTTNKVFLFDIVQDKSLVFRFSGESCNVCIDFVMNKIKQNFSDFAYNDKILFIGSNINVRLKEKYYGKKLISFTSEDLGLPFEDYNTPFLFIIDRDRICKLIFVPEKSMPELIDLYLKAIKDRYFKLQ